MKVGDFAVYQGEEVEILEISGGQALVEFADARPAKRVPLSELSKLRSRALTPVQIQEVKFMATELEMSPADLARNIERHMKDGLSFDEALELVEKSVGFEREWSTKWEKRAALGRVEVREAEGQPTILTGRAVVYDSWSEMIYGAFRERIKPGAFDRCLATNPDVVCSVDHDLHKIVGRKASGTLKIEPREDGIWIEVSDPRTSYSDDLVKLVKRGDVRGMSFMFDVRRDKWHQQDGINSRDVLDADIYEVSFVVFPCYPETVAYARSRALARMEAALPPLDPIDAYRRREREVLADNF